MNELSMTDEEIKMRYRDGTSTQILSELNDCKPVRIRAIVKGIRHESAKKTRVRGPSRRTPDDIMRLYEALNAGYLAGLNDAESAVKNHCTQAMVCQWRAKNELPPNRHKRKKLAWEMHREKEKGARSNGKARCIN